MICGHHFRFDAIRYRAHHLSIRLVLDLFGEHLKIRLNPGFVGFVDFFELIEKLQASLRSEEHTSELQSLTNLVCRLLLEKKKTIEATSLRVIRRRHYTSRDPRRGEQNRR